MSELVKKENPLIGIASVIKPASSCIRKGGIEMRFTVAFGIIGVIYSIFWYEQALPSPNDVFTAIIAGASIDILLLLRQKPKIFR